MCLSLVTVAKLRLDDHCSVGDLHQPSRRSQAAIAAVWPEKHRQRRDNGTDQGVFGEAGWDVKAPPEERTCHQQLVTTIRPQLSMNKSTFLPEVSLKYRGEDSGH